MGSITIFEGPDGSGKTTAAKEFAAATRAHYYHFSAWRHMEGHLPRLFVEAMLPALLDGKNVVLDRCWLSEKPYNDAFHRGNLVITEFHHHVLERLCMRCNTVVVLCLPEFEVCLENFNKRRDTEMLTTHKQLADVYEAYKEMSLHTLNKPYHTHSKVFDYTAQQYALPMIHYDYIKDWDIVSHVHSVPFTFANHPRVEKRTVGNYTADTLIVGDLSVEMEQVDTLNRFPTIGFTVYNPFNHIADLLRVDHDMTENMLLWVDTDALEFTLDWRIKMGFVPRQIICLDDRADEVAHRIVDGNSVLKNHVGLRLFGAL